MENRKNVNAIDKIIAECDNRDYLMAIIHKERYIMYRYMINDQEHGGIVIANSENAAR